MAVSEPSITEGTSPFTRFRVAPEPFRKVVFAPAPMEKLCQERMAVGVVCVMTSVFEDGLERVALPETSWPPVGSTGPAARASKAVAEGEHRRPRQKPQDGRPPSAGSIVCVHCSLAPHTALRLQSTPRLDAKIGRDSRIHTHAMVCFIWLQLGL